MTLDISTFSGQSLDALPSIGQLRVVRAPLVIAGAETLAGYGRLVEDFEGAEVQIVPWPTTGWRGLVDGTGNEGGIVQDTFEMTRRGQVQYAVNHAVNRSYVTGWFGDPATAREDVEPTDLNRLYTHEANYHPDGGQVFFPRDGAPFVALLARPGDDVCPEDFVAFWFDGSLGVHIDAGVWHQPVFPTSGQAVFDDKQGRVHACVSVDFLGEFGTWVEVPLTR